MAQVNVAYDDALLAHIDAVAQGRGLSRPDLLRAIAEAAVRASQQGRALFEPAEQSFDPATALALATRVEQQNIELDRILRATERREKKMLQAFHATEEANQNALARIGEQLTSRFAEGTTPFSEMLAEHGNRIELLKRDVISAARSPEWVAGFEAKLNLIEAAAEKPRTLNQFEIAPEWRLPAWQWCIAATLALILAAIVITSLARIVPDSWVATPMARAMYGSEDRGMCELWKARYDTGGCPVLVPMEEDPAP